MVMYECKDKYQKTHILTPKIGLHALDVLTMLNMFVNVIGETYMTTY